MNINTELEKLIGLRDRGDLSQAEFEKAKKMLLSELGAVSISPQRATPDDSSPASAIPGLGLAAGVFVGNFLLISIGSGDPARGFIIGAIAAFLVIVFSLVAQAIRLK